MTGYNEVNTDYLNIKSYRKINIQTDLEMD